MCALLFWKFTEELEDSGWGVNACVHGGGWGGGGEQMQFCTNGRTSPSHGSDLFLISWQTECRHILIFLVLILMNHFLRLSSGFENGMQLMWDS